MPTVDEIIFRHQQAETAQAALVRNYVANARISIHFQPTPLDSYDVITENRFFSDTETAEWEELSFSLNGTRWGRNRPPFPLLQPEKVLSLPLALRLNRDYVYHLVGEDRVDDRPCYVVAFDPVDETKSLYRGRVWIDAERYVRLKVQAVQTGLDAPVVSNEEVQIYEPVASLGDRPVYLFSRLTSRQIMLIAGRNLLVEKQVVFSDFRVNDEKFAEERQQARRSDALMYRDTDARAPAPGQARRRARRQRHDNDERQGAGRRGDVRPVLRLPAAAVRHRLRELQLPEPGPAVRLPLLGRPGSREPAEGEDRGHELRRERRLLRRSPSRATTRCTTSRASARASGCESRPVSTGVNLGYQLTDFQKITLSSHIQYDAFFVVAGAHRRRLRRAGQHDDRQRRHQLRVPARRLLAARPATRTTERARWEPWGDGSGLRPVRRAATRSTTSALSKDFYFGTFNKIHLNAAYYGGQRHDRFSMYRFGLFDETRMRGIPSAGVRFSELGMAARLVLVQPL